MTSTDTWHCEHCDAPFQPKAGAKARCPACLRTTGLTRLDSDAPARKVSSSTIVGVAALALAAGGLLWFFSQHRADQAQESAPPPGRTVVDAPDEPNGPEPVTPPPPSTPSVDMSKSPSVAELVKGWIAGANTPSARVRQVLTALHSHIEIQAPGDPLGRDVLRPEAAAKALLSAGDPVKLTGLEAGALLHAALGALGLSPIAVVVPGDFGGATSVRHRDLGVRVAVIGIDGVLVPARSGASLQLDLPDTPGQPESSLRALEALRLAEKKRFDDAATAVSDALAASPGDAALEFLRGQLLLVRGQFEGGLDALEAAVARAEDAEGRYQLAVALLREGQTFPAWRALERAVELEPKHATAWSALGQLALERASTLPEDQRAPIHERLDAIEKALQAIDRGAEGLIELRVQRLLLADKPDQARELAVEALNMYPRRAPLHMLLAQMAARRGETAVAERHFEKAAEADPWDAEPLMELAQVHAGRGENDQVLARLQQASDRAPFDPEIMAELTSALHQAGRAQEALEAATELSRRFPDLLDGPLLVAQLSLEMDNAAGAAAIIEEALKKHPREPTLHVLLYFTYASLNQPERAEEAMKRLLLFDPEGRMRIAQQLLQSAQVEAATQLMEQELAEKPTRIEVAITLAQLHRLAEHADEVARLRAHVAKHAPPDQKAELLTLFDNAMKEIDAQASQAGEPPSP